MIGPQTDLGASDGVERDGPGKAPTAFRIWPFGTVRSDLGERYVTEETGVKIQKEAEARGREYAIDVDHLSLSSVAPPESRGAVGWFTPGVREDGIWAEAVRWSDFAREGLEANPPKFRFMSPAFDYDTNTLEIVGLTNLALTINPLTHKTTALAAAGATMDETVDQGMPGEEAPNKPESEKEDKLAQMIAMLMALEPAEREKLVAMIKATEGTEAAQAAEAGDDTPADEEKKPEAAAAEPEKAADKMSAAGITDAVKKALAAELAPIKAQLAKQAEAEKKRLDAQIATERASLAATAGLPDDLKKVIQDKTTSIATARQLASIGAKFAADPRAQLGHVGAAGNKGAPAIHKGTGLQMPPAEMASAMGINRSVPKPAGVREIAPGLVEMRRETPAQTRARLAGKAAS